MTLRTAADEPIRFFLPGPSYVLAEVRQAQAVQPVAHRSAAFREVYGRVTAGLAEVFRTKRDVVVATGSATLLMQAAVQSCVGRRVLHLVNGAFSDRWRAIARSLGKEADAVEVPWGRAVDPDLLRAALRRARYDAVTLAHSETSTGVLNPLAELAATVREESDALLLVDAVSSLGGARVETDAWGLDVVLTASQKALAVPPGLAFAAVSQRAEERMAGVAGRGFYTDLVRYLAKHREGGTITTPAATLVHALDRQLGGILGEGMEARWERHAGLRRQVEEWAAGAGMALFAPEGARSPTVTALRCPPGATGPGLVAALGDLGFTIAAGYGDVKATTFRIGHMGEHRPADLAGLLAAIDDLGGSRA